jgi:hypothetical protein
MIPIFQLFEEYFLIAIPLWSTTWNGSTIRPTDTENQWNINNKKLVKK